MIPATASVSAISTNKSQADSISPTNITGGCLCGQLRYEAKGSPAFSGTCSCLDCRRSSGSGSVGFMGFACDAIRFIGETTHYQSISFLGHDVVRHHCARCGSLVFGGMSHSTGHVVFAGSLDDPNQFKPTTAIFNRSRPSWSPLPEGVQVFETMPE